MTIAAKKTGLLMKAVEVLFIRAADYQIPQVNLLGLPSVAIPLPETVLYGESWLETKLGAACDVFIIMTSFTVSVQV